MINVYIGPNGFGKTTKLHEEKDRLISSGVPEKEVLFLDSEILLLDEVKDTKDESKTMEFIVQELFMNSATFLTTKIAFENQVRTEITNNQALMNSILDDILSLNGSTRSPGSNFIDINTKMVFKNLVKIETKDIKGKTGSGQRMQLILSLVKHSGTKKYVFLDEPEKYSHPSSLHRTAKLIQELDANGINIYIASHSPKLLSMIDLDFDNIHIINDATHSAKTIDFLGIVSSFAFSSLGSFGQKEKSFYSVPTLKDNIKNIYYREFIESLFTKKVFLCEGINDKFFIMKALKTDNKFYDDYCIFQTFGKFIMPVFEKIFSSLGIETQVFFDEDTPKRSSDSKHLEIDSYLESLTYYEFKPCLEVEIGFSLPDKNNTVGFIDFLDSLTLETNKYIK